MDYRGGARTRAGTLFCGFSKQTGRSVPPRLITFQFSINQGLALEFGNFYMRVVSDGAFVVESSKTVTGITQANPAVVTAAAHGYANGDWVALSGVNGMTQVNGQTYVVASATTNTFALHDVFGNNINSTGFGAYTSGGGAARVFTLATPWAEADLEYIKFTQSADVMSLCCWNQITGTSYPPYDLTRIADDNWSVAEMFPGPTVPAVSGPVSAAISITGTTFYAYEVTCVNPKDGTESTPSSLGVVFGGDIATTAGTIQLSWATVPGVEQYNIYKAMPGQSPFPPPAGALFGYAGSSYSGVFIDSNTVPDFAQVPPTHRNPFAPGAIVGVPITNPGSGITALAYTITTSTGANAFLELERSGGTLNNNIIADAGLDYAPGDTITYSGTFGVQPTATLTIGPTMGTYPSVVAYFQERRVYAASPNNPDTYWMSQPGAFTTFDFRIPTIDSDAITGTPWSVEVNGIQYMISMPGGLVVLTGLSAWQLTGVGGSSLNPQPITPANQQAQPQAFNGCSSTVPPVKVDYDILYVQAKGSIVRDLSYSFYLNIYTGTDLTILSSQLFTGYTIREWAYCEEPLKIIWTVRNDGVLLSLTYLKPQEVSGWARHDTQGFFQSACSVTEPPVDALYLAVQRMYPSGAGAYMIERMDDRIWASVEDCWCVDSGLTLAMPAPACNLVASTATGLGSITGATGLVGGANYSALTYAVVVDDDNEGPGSGAVPTLTIVGGVITAITFSGGSQGSKYTYPRIDIFDPANTGSGASAAPVLNNFATFFAAANIFSPGSVGQVIRGGGGIAVITQYVTASQVNASVISPIVGLIPNSGGTPAPFLSGSWTLTTPVTTISGLDHLAGFTVTGLADGNVIPPTVVSAAGTITLATPASAVIVGLGFQAQLQSLYLDYGAPTIQGQRKKIAAATARIEASRGFKIGSNQPDGSTFSPQQLAPTWRNLSVIEDGDPSASSDWRPPYGSAVYPLFTGDVRVTVSGGFAKPGQVALQQDAPLPLQVLAIVPEVLPGDEPQLQARDRQASGQRKAA